MSGPDVHYVRTTLAVYTFCGYRVSAVNVTRDRGRVSCARCKREGGLWLRA